MTGLIDVGGGMRDVYGSGVIDCFIDNGITFDMCIGVSAGSANIANLLSSQRERTFRFYTEYSSRKEYMSMQNFIRTGSYFDLDYIYSTLSDEDGEDPIDFQAISSNPCPMITVVTDAESGKSVYLGKEEISRNDLWVIKASCAVPGACRPFRHNGKEYFDGGISDPIPVEKAFEMGCDKVVVIMPRPAKEKKSEHSRLMKPFLKGYPAILKLIADRPEIYNRELKILNDYITQGKVILISPDDDKGITMVTTDKAKLTAFYNKGYHDAEAVLDKII